MPDYQTHYTDLRPYQQQDVEFLMGRRTAALLSEQRTGKTPTVLVALKKKGIQRVLIVCPNSAVYPWADEYRLWTGDPCIAIAGDAHKRRQLYSQWTHGLVVSYDLLRRQQLDFECVQEHMPEAIVLDEAHRIRNPKTDTAKAIFNLLQIPTRICLTGTPTPNHAKEVWSLMHFLCPKTFSSYWDFIYKNFNTSRQSNPTTGKVFIDIGMPTPEGQSSIRTILRALAVQHKRKDVMPWLPEKNYTYVRLPLNTLQKKYLDELRTVWETEHIITKGTLDRLIRYRQICLDPGLLDLKGEAPKTAWIQDYLQDYPERPTIIFSKFTSYIKRLADALPQEKGVIIGETPVKTRQQYCQDFQAGKMKLLLINIDAGKEALTLDTAEATIFTDRYPPVGDLEQAEDRFVSTTPDKANKPHLIYILSMRESYDDMINLMITERKTETDIVNNFAQYMRRT